MTRTRTTRVLAAVLAFLLFATLLFAGMPVRAAGELVLKEGAAITYNKDASVMKADAVKALVDFEASGIPADYDLNDFEMDYAFLGANAVADVLGIDVSGLPGMADFSNLWVNVETGRWNPPGDGVVMSWIASKVQDGLSNLGISFNHIQAGEDQIVRVRYQGGDWVTGSLTVNKANVKVNVRSAALYFDQVKGENFVTTDPEDDFMIFTFYAGITTDVAPTVYFQPPESPLLDKAMPFIDAAYKALYGVTLTDRLNEGTTVGEIRVIADQMVDVLQKASETTLGRLALEAAGVDVDMINGLVDGMQQISQIADNWRFAIGQPNRAGAYVVAAVAINRNYNPGIGAGVLLVKMRLFGVSLQWNSPDAKEVSVSELGNVDFGAQAFYEGEARDQNVRVLFVGLTSEGLYFSGDAPTAAGRYLETAFPLGGNYLAIPIVRVVTVNEG